MLAPLALLPETMLSYHWAALAGAFVKVPLLCSLLWGDPIWAGWRIGGAFYGLLLGPLLAALQLPQVPFLSPKGLFDKLFGPFRV